MQNTIERLKKKEKGIKENVTKWILQRYDACTSLKKIISKSQVVAKKLGSNIVLLNR